MDKTPEERIAELERLVAILLMNSPGMWIPEEMQRDGVERTPQSDEVRAMYQPPE